MKNYVFLTAFALIISTILPVDTAAHAASSRESSQPAIEPEAAELNSELQSIERERQEIRNARKMLIANYLPGFKGGQPPLDGEEFIDLHVSAEIMKMTKTFEARVSSLSPREADTQAARIEAAINAHKKISERQRALDERIKRYEERLGSLGAK